MHKALHPRDDGNRVYVSRKEGRGLTSIQESVDASMQQLEDYVKKRSGRLVTPSRKKCRQHNHQLNKDNHKTIERRKTTVWTFHAANKRNLKRGNLTWLRKEKIKGGTQFLLIASQNNAIRTM